MRLSITPISAVTLVYWRARKLETKPRNRRNAVIFCVGNDLKQFGRTITPLGRDDAELGHVAADRIRQHRALPHQQLSAPVQHQASLLLACPKSHNGQTVVRPSQAPGSIPRAQAETCSGGTSY